MSSLGSFFIFLLECNICLWIISKLAVLNLFLLGRDHILEGFFVCVFFLPFWFSALIAKDLNVLEGQSGG